MEGDQNIEALQSNMDGIGGDEKKEEESGGMDGEEKGGGGGFFSTEDIVSKLSGSRRSNRSQTSKVSHRSAALSATSSISLNEISTGGVEAGFSHLLEQKFFELVNENESRQVEEMLWKYKHEVQVGGRDEDGFSALGIAAVSGSLEMMETLLRSGSPITDEPLICIEQDFKQGLMLLLDKLAKRGVDGANLTMATKSGGLYPKGANCVMVASVNNNIDLLKVLTYYGAKPLPAPTVRVPSIFDVSSKRKNVLESGEAILYSMKALASPAYALVIASDDPLMSSFQMSQRCRYLAKMFPVLREEFMKLSEQQEVFAAEWLGTAADNYEVNIVLALEDETDRKQKSRRNKVHDPYARLNYALRHNHERFVSHPYVQQQLFKHFATGMPAQWYDRGATFQLLFLTLLFFLCPIWTILYWLCPSGPKWHARLGHYLEIPIMKLILHVQFYISLLIAIILNQNYLTPVDWFVGGNNVARFMHDQLQKAADVEITITPPLDAFNVYVAIWNFGNAYYEYKNFRHLGPKRYWTAMNVSNLLMTFFYMNTIALTLVMWTSGEENPTQPFYLDISNALTINAVLGKMFLIFKVVHWLKLNNTFGRTFYLAVAPLASMGAFWFMAVLVLITFVVPINMLTSNSYVQIVELCEVADYRTLTINNVSIGQDRLENIASIECAEISDEDNPYHQRTIDELREFISLWAIGYRLLISLFGFDTQHRIVRLMGNYATRQEFLAAILIGVYIFIMVILRLNVLLAIVVNTLSNIYSYLNTGFKFERTKVMMPFVDVTSTCWMPSPICMVPTLRYVWTSVNKVFEKRKPDYSEPDPTKILFRANQMEAEKKRKNAAKRVVSEISVRMLRVVSARHREKPVSVDNLSDLKAMMSPRLNATSRRTKRLEQELFDLLQFRDPYLQLKKKY